MFNTIKNNLKTLMKGKMKKFLIREDSIYYEDEKLKHFIKEKKKKIIKFLLDKSPYIIDFKNEKIYRKFKINIFYKFLKKEFKKLNLVFIRDGNIVFFVKSTNRYNELVINKSLNQDNEYEVLIINKDRKFDEGNTENQILVDDLNIIYDIINKIMKNKFNYYLHRKVKNYQPEDFYDVREDYFCYKYGKK